jgi:hypothetical protein
MDRIRSEPKEIVMYRIRHSSAPAECSIVSTQPGRYQDPRAPGGVGRARPRLLPRTLQLCIHCRESPAGFWVSGKNAKTVRRPWCLACCEELDRGHCDVIPFGG